MNEKLNELRLDAGIARIEKQQWLCVLDKETGMMIDPMIGLEKFAELIVEEVYDYILNVTFNDEPWPSRKDVKTHFGVKE